VRRLPAAILVVVLAGLGTFFVLARAGGTPGDAGLAATRFEDPEDLLYSNLYVADLRSGRLTRLTRNHGEERVVTDPDWMPDGRSLLYAQVPCDDCPAVLLHIPAGGGRPTGVSPGSHPSVLPDGRRLAFTGPAGGISLGRVDGGGRRRVETAQRPWSEPTVSPDGRRLAAVVQAPDERTHVALLSLRGKLLRLLPAVGRSLANPAWAPDGRRVAFSAMRADGRWAVLSMRTNGRGLRRLVAGGSDTAASFSPDGRRLVFVRAEHGTPTLLIAGADGRGVRPLLGRRLVGYQPTFSPDGTRVAFVVHRGRG
jgi:TolB protein